MNGMCAEVAKAESCNTISELVRYTHNAIDDLGATLDGAGMTPAKQAPGEVASAEDVVKGSIAGLEHALERMQELRIRLEKLRARL